MVPPASVTATPSTFSSAPKVEEFTPPEPTPTDPYPGYYLLPSGSWAAYDPTYYRSFYNKWEKEYNAHVRALEKGKLKGFEDLETTDTRDVNAQQEMEKAKREIQEREQRKAVTHGAGGPPAAPRMNIKVCHVSDS
jgi:proline-rich protein PRCC